MPVVWLSGWMVVVSDNWTNSFVFIRDFLSIAAEQVKGEKGNIIEIQSINFSIKTKMNDDDKDCKSSTVGHVSYEGQHEMDYSGRLSMGGYKYSVFGVSPKGSGI